jgi:hypothetical protein
VLVGSTSGCLLNTSEKSQCGGGWLDKGQESERSLFLLVRTSPCFPH